ncbi:MAG: hypothetical protein IKR60_01035 [Alphaproteobacteria bacterium]|nr:hypothetical protein [Alphaproteobacteria bacterium]MBR6327445.1 hypothetical protein [Alphaproteobacteria bacterium]
MEHTTSIVGERVSSIIEVALNEVWYKNADGSSTLYNEEGKPIQFK